MILNGGSAKPVSIGDTGWVKKIKTFLIIALETAIFTYKSFR